MFLNNYTKRQNNFQLIFLLNAKIIAYTFFSLSVNFSSLVISSVNIMYLIFSSSNF